MNHTLEHYWVSVRDSDRWRRFAKWGPGAMLFRSQAYRRLETARRYLASYHAAQRDPRRFDDLRTFCVLIGHAKSGGTMIGSLLDAHPNIVFADEADALRYVSAGFRRDQICHILLKGSRREAMKGRVTARRLGAYSFQVPKQWQGRFSHLQIIGDSRAGPSTGRIRGDPDLLDRLQQVMHDLQVKLIHVVRNPYDPISAMMIRGNRTFENAIGHYFNYCQTLDSVRQCWSATNLFTSRYETLVREPEATLGKLCRFLGAEAGRDYVRACSDILDASPQQFRHRVRWNSKWIRLVQTEMARFDFLAGYSFEN